MIEKTNSPKSKAFDKLSRIYLPWVAGEVSNGEYESVIREYHIESLLEWAEKSIRKY